MEKIKVVLRAVLVNVNSIRLGYCSAGGSSYLTEWRNHIRFEQSGPLILGQSYNRMGRNMNQKSIISIVISK